MEARGWCIVMPVTGQRELEKEYTRYLIRKTNWEAWHPERVRMRAAKYAIGGGLIVALATIVAQVIIEKRPQRIIDREQTVRLDSLGASTSKYQGAVNDLDWQVSILTTNVQSLRTAVERMSKMHSSPPQQGAKEKGAQ